MVLLKGILKEQLSTGIISLINMVIVMEKITFLLNILRLKKKKQLQH